MIFIYWRLIYEKCIHSIFLTSSCFALTFGFHPSLLKGCADMPKGVEDGLFAIWGGVTALCDWFSVTMNKNSSVFR